MIRQDEFRLCHIPKLSQAARLRVSCVSLSFVSCYDTERLCVPVMKSGKMPGKRCQVEAVHIFAATSL